MITFTSRGSFDRTEAWLRGLGKNNLRATLEKYGHEGVQALAAATPKDSGLASGSWTFEVKTTGKSSSIVWKNTDTESGFPVAIMIQYGHGTGSGGFISGRDYINPAMRPIFDRLSTEVWRAVTNG